MQKFTDHSEPWGEFVDVKTNAAELLEKELKRINKGSVIISSVTDPYQSIEAEHRLTRRCLEILKDTGLSVSILTKSPLVLRDIDLFREFKDLEVGLTISTDSEDIRKLFEPAAPPIELRIKALKQLHSEGIRTYAFIAPLLPMNPERLARRLFPHVDMVLIDRMNYTYKTRMIYNAPYQKARLKVRASGKRYNKSNFPCIGKLRPLVGVLDKKHGLEKWLDRGFTEEIIQRLRRVLEEKEVVLC